MKLFSQKKSDPDLKKQFENLNKLYINAKSELQKLIETLPDYNDVWSVVADRIKIIEHSISTQQFPTSQIKQDAHIGIILAKECSALHENKSLNVLYQLDNDYQLMGLGSPSDDEIERFLNLCATKKELS